jgi:hypothetical protein
MQGIRSTQYSIRTSKTAQVPVEYRIVSLLPLLVVVLAVFTLRLYLALTDPVLRAIDPWWWAPKIETYAQGLTIERVYEPLAPGGWGSIVYPRGYPLLSALIALATGTSGYEIVRFYPVISALNLIPMYFLSFLISKSHRVATITIILVTISKWYSIRTSIGGAECFTHFWLVFSLLFLLRLRDQPTRRNIAASVFFVTATLLFWHYPIAIYAILFPLLCVANLRNRSYCKKITTVGITSAIVAGSLWYFWAPLSGWTRLAQYLGVFSLSSTPGVYPEPVGSWGYVLIFLGSVGFVYVLGRLRTRRDPSKIFLITYFFSIVALILASSRLGWLGVYYGFSNLALPLSVFAAFGLVAAADMAAPTLEKLTAASRGPFTLTKGKWPQTLTLLFLLVVIIASSSPANYRGDTAYPGWYEAVYYDQLIGGHPAGLDYLGLRWIVTFQYGKAFDAPSSDLYFALTWIRTHSSEQSCVGAFLLRPPPSSLCPSPDKPCPYSVLQGAFSTISERNLITTKELGAQLAESATEWRDRILRACDGDVYIVTGIRSWSGETWADTHLESKVLSYAAQSPNVISEVYSVGETRVFRIAKALASQVVDISCQAMPISLGRLSSPSREIARLVSWSSSCPPGLGPHWD